MNEHVVGPGHRACGPQIALGWRTPWAFRAYRGAQRDGTVTLPEAVEGDAHIASDVRIRTDRADIPNRYGLRDVRDPRGPSPESVRTANADLAARDPRDSASAGRMRAVKVDVRDTRIDAEHWVPERTVAAARREDVERI